MEKEKINKGNITNWVQWDSFSFRKAQRARAECKMLAIQQVVLVGTGKQAGVPFGLKRERERESKAAGMRRHQPSAISPSSDPPPSSPAPPIQAIHIPCLLITPQILLPYNNKIPFCSQNVPFPRPSSMLSSFLPTLPISATLTGINNHCISDISTDIIY